MKKEVENIKKALTSKLPSATIPIKNLLSTGSTLLNLALSGKRSGGFYKGLYALIVGDSSSGKTFLSMTCLAEASINKHFSDYRFIYDDIEGGALMDIERFFGKRMAEKLEPPSRDDDGNPIYSSTVEELLYHLDDAIKTGVPFIYITDSMDALDTEDDTQKFEEKKTAHRKGKQTSGSYGTAKPKLLSAGIRKIVGKLKKSGSIWVVLSQTRDNVGFGSQFEPKTRSGGRALRFYARVEIWSSISKKIKKTVNGKARQIGILCKVQVKKNSIVGRLSTVEFPIYWSTGVDDIGGCIDWLISEGHWKGTEAQVKAPEFDYNGSKAKLIKIIEDDGREKELQMLVAKVWQEIEAACCVERKSRYE